MTTETFHHARAAMARLRASLAEADEDTRYKFAFWITGMLLMAIAIIVAFGWPGVLFCVGVFVYAAGRNSEAE